MDCIPASLFEGNSSDLLSSWGSEDSSVSAIPSTAINSAPHHPNTSTNTTLPSATPAVQGSGHSTLSLAEQFLYGRAIVIICLFGVIGNALNLLVLTRKGLQKTMDRMEKSAHFGLVALALSDMLFCFAVIPHAWVDKYQFYHYKKGFSVYYTLYGDAVINAFIMSSTWLTVAMATSRYLAICHPLRAREIIGMTFAKVSIVLVFLICVLFNLPRFWLEEVDTMDCVGAWRVYFPRPGALRRNPPGEQVYLWLYFVFGILVPLVALAFCNGNLIRALHQSTKMRRQYQNNHTSSRETTHHITLTLIIIVIMYFLLVVPAEAINFLKQTVIDEIHATESFNLAIAIVNTLQAINFACNFILYCAINVHFRRTVVDLFCWVCLRKSREEAYLSQRYESVTMSQSGYTRHTAISEF